MTRSYLAPDINRMVKDLRARIERLERRQEPVAEPATGGDAEHDGVGAGSTVINLSTDSPTADGTAAVAVGQNATAPGSYGVAVGSAAQVDEANGIAIGQAARTWQEDGIAIGRSARTDYDNDDIDRCVAVGASSFAGAGKAVAVGYDTSAGPSAVAVGYHAVAVQTGNDGHGVAIGAESTVGASSVGGVAVGANAEVVATSAAAIAIGADSLADGDNCIVIGKGATSSFGNAHRSVAIGYQADTGGVWDAVALGANVTATVNDQVALGNANSFIASAGADGLVIRSPDGTRWRITVDNAGALSVATA